MSLKEKILFELENAKGSYISGDTLAQRYDVSRNAVCKAVKGLKESGYEINAVTNKGYCLSEKSDIISAAGIEKFLGNDVKDISEIIVYDEVTSTNTLAKEAAQAGAAEGAVIIARRQTQGRGRMGRSFFSPSGSGIYMTLVLRPKLPPEKALSLTTMAAVAVSEAIDEISGQKSAIKWVNDIFLNGKKVCGILTEASISVEGGGLDYAVVGIGINVFAPEEGFPDEISGVAASVFGSDCPDARNRLAAAVIRGFFSYYKGRVIGYADEYRKRSFVIGKNVVVSRGEERFNALVTDIDDECRLKLRFDNGTEQLLSSGEIRIASIEDK